MHEDIATVVDAGDGVRAAMDGVRECVLTHCAAMSTGADEGGGGYRTQRRRRVAATARACTRSTASAAAAVAARLRAGCAVRPRPACSPATAYADEMPLGRPAAAAAAPPTHFSHCTSTACCSASGARCSMGWMGSQSVVHAYWVARALDGCDGSSLDLWWSAC